MSKNPFTNVKRSVSRLFNFRAMIDFDRIKHFTRYVGELAQTYFVPQSTKKSESFEEARVKLNLTEDDLLAKQRALLRLCLLMVLLAIGFFCYAIYQFLYGSILGGIPSCTLCCIALALAFRYHFWYFQIKSRQLGCTFSQWRHRGTKEENQ